MIVYLSGPMTGYPDWNYPRFNSWAKLLRDIDYVVLNPAENFGGRTDLPRHVYMRLDLQLVMQSEVVATITGWEASEGAVLETQVARACLIPVVPVETLASYEAWQAEAVLHA